MKGAGKLFGLTVFLVTVFGLLGHAQQPDTDQEALENLQRVGFDVSRVHKLQFFLHFPTKKAAERATRQIKEAGYATRVDRDRETHNWLCTATKAMVPELTALRKARVEFECIAASEGGEYSGWGGSLR